MGFSGFGEALISIAPAKMLIAWSLRSFRKVSSRPMSRVSDIALHAHFLGPTQRCPAERAI